MTLDLELFPEDTNESFAERNAELFLQHRTEFVFWGGEEQLDGEMIDNPRMQLFCFKYK